MHSQEREHTARLQQMPGHRLDIQQLALRIRSSLHPKIIPDFEDQQVKPRGLIRRVLARLPSIVRETVA
jgi:hypothetical protein